MEEHYNTMQKLSMILAEQPQERVPDMLLFLSDMADELIARHPKRMNKEFYDDTMAAIKTANGDEKSHMAIGAAIKITGTLFLPPDEPAVHICTGLNAITAGHLDRYATAAVIKGLLFALGADHLIKKHGELSTDITEEQSDESVLYGERVLINRIKIWLGQQTA